MPHEKNSRVVNETYKTDLKFILTSRGIIHFKIKLHFDGIKTWAGFLCKLI